MIDVFQEDNEWKVWIGEDRSHGGICIGIGQNKAAALRDASDELLAEINRIRQMQKELK